MVLIFKLSSENAGISSRRSGLILELVQKIFSDFLEESLSHIIRKFAHFTLYFLLGCSLQLSFDDNSQSQRNKFMVFIIIFLYACSDELHQAFIPGRSSEFLDVMIDSAGGLTSIAMLTFFRKIFKNI